MLTRKKSEQKHRLEAAIRSHKRTQLAQRRKPAENASLIIATAALLVSMGQLIMGSSILSGYIIKPKLIISGRTSQADSQVLSGVFSVKNVGNAPATKVEVGILAQSDQRVSTAPNFGTRIVLKETQEYFTKDIRLEIERILPQEQVVIFVLPGPNLEQLRPDVAKMLKGASVPLPSISFLRSAEDIGEIRITALQDTDTHKSSYR